MSIEGLPAPRPPSRFVGIYRILAGCCEGLRKLLMAFAEMGAMLFGVRKRGHRPWQAKIGSRTAPIKLSEREIEYLLQRQRNLKDLDKIASFALKFKLPESNYFGDPEQVEQLIRRILEANPPWLYVGRTLAGSDNDSGVADTEILWRMDERQEMQDVQVFFPADEWRDLPLASLTMRPAKNLSEVWQSRLLEQVMPPEIILDRCQRGEILIPSRNKIPQRLEFSSEICRLEVTVRRPFPVSIEMHGEYGKGGQLLYILLDMSGSMQGKSATLALAVISATLRANLGQRNARYLFRRFAEEEAIWPPEIECPVQAKTLEEKDRLIDLITETNFNGGATHVNHALNVAIRDVENLRQAEQLEAQILLVTDGRVEMLESTRQRLREANIHLHTVSMIAQANPDLAAISESYTILDIDLEKPVPLPRVLSEAQNRPKEQRRSYRI